MAIVSSGLAQLSPNWFQHVVEEPELKPKAMFVLRDVHTLASYSHPLLFYFYC